MRKLINAPHILFSVALLGILFCPRAQAGWKKETKTDSSARDAFLAKINGEVAVLEGAIKRLNESAKEREQQNQEMKLHLFDVHAERDSILKNREDLIKDYLNIKAQIQATRSAYEGLRAMQNLLARVVEHPLASEVTDFLKEYAQSTVEQKAILRGNLRQLRKKSLDPEDSKSIAAIESALEYYGVYISEEPDPKAPKKDAQELEVVESTFSKLQTYFQAGDSILRAQAQLCQEVTQKQKLEFERLGTELAKLKESGGEDFENLEKYTAEIEAKSSEIKANLNYNATLAIERAKMEAQLIEVNGRRKDAPGVRVWEERYYEPSSSAADRK